MKITLSREQLQAIYASLKSNHAIIEIDTNLKTATYIDSFGGIPETKSYIETSH